MPSGNRRDQENVGPVRAKSALTGPIRQMNMNPSTEIGSGNESTLSTRLDRVFEAALREKRIVGAVALVAKDGKVIYRQAHGQADREANRPMREDAQFRLASVTKPVVTLAVLRLVAEGRMQLDAPITR